MTLEHFENTNFKPESMETIEKANEIIADYAGRGYSLTLRQLYYQFVARDLLPNTERSYKNLGNLITKGRMAGLVSWTALEDRTRNLLSWPVDEEPESVIRGAINDLRFDFWQRMPAYVEEWVEKEALAEVVGRACAPRYVPHLACKGYLSASDSWRAGKRFEKAKARGQDCVIVHLGDHDPSGLDMTRDNDVRTNLFAWAGGNIDVRRIALNMDQVEEYGPPENPTKMTDSRAPEYVGLYGFSCWELDALDPETITALIQTEIESLVDVDAWEEADAAQQTEREKIRWVARHWYEVMELMNQ